MSLRLITTADERLLGTGAIDVIRAALGATGHALVLAPSLAASLEAQRELAAASVSMGVDCATPATWAELRWALYGDGRKLMSDAQRCVLMARLVLAGDNEPMGTSTGTIDLLCEVAKKALPWLPEADAQTLQNLSVGEGTALDLLHVYHGFIAERGFVEPCEAQSLLPGLMAKQGCKLPACFMVGYGEMDRATREFAVALARVCELNVCVRSDGGPAFGLAEASAEALAAAAGAAGMEVFRASEAGVDMPRAEELSQLVTRLYRPEVGEPMMPAGSVELLEPAGPLAVDETTRQEVLRLAEAGASHVVVVCPNVEASWRGLAPKLHAHGIDVRAQVSRSADETRMGAGFMRLAKTVAKLAELDASWPEDPAAELPDMSWWPPRDLVDFLMLSTCGVGTERAWRRDVAWRGNRILTPADVLKTLQNSGATSPRVASAVREILQGHLAAAAGRLMGVGEEKPETAADGEEAEAALAPSAEELLGTDMDEAALRAVAECGRALRDAGISLGEGASSLSELIQLAEIVLPHINVYVRTRLAAGGAACSVELVSPSAAAKMAPCSADALIYLGLDSNTSPIPESDGALERLLIHLGADEPTDALAKARADFAATVRVPRQRLALMRPARNEKADETFPAVMLTEVISCYAVVKDEKTGKEASALAPLAASKLDEGAVEVNLSAESESPASRKVAPRAEAGKLDPALRRLVMVPRDGQAELPGGRPMLSASQVETYLECPYKWFTLRRLGLDNVDAGFSNMEMGTFAHRVLEVSHRRLFMEAAVEAGLIAEGSEENPEGSLFWFDPSVRVPGSRVSPENLGHALELLHAEFAEHLLHQRLEGSSRNKQALIPHVPSEVRRLGDLENDLASALEYEATRLDGFEPRLFEGRFGGRSGLPASYAGADFVGTIDRIDVDAEGRAIVIDYKHKSNLFDEYALVGKDGPDWEAGFALPGRVQTLVYASIARNLLRDTGIEVVGAIYLGTKGNHAISGALSPHDALAVLGDDAAKKADHLCVPVPGARSFDELLDRTEEAMSVVIDRMRAGEVEARPATPHACDWCPVTGCERRQK